MGVEPLACEPIPGPFVCGLTPTSPLTNGECWLLASSLGGGKLVLEAAQPPLDFLPEPTFQDVPGEHLRRVCLNKGLYSLLRALSGDGREWLDFAPFFATIFSSLFPEEEANLAEPRTHLE